MANTQESKTPVNAVPDHGDHDRVVMLSLHSDGTPAQVAPELIGDKDAVEEAAREQFRQQAISAADVKERGVAGGTPGTAADAAGPSSSSKEDPVIARLKAAHEKAAKAGESAAEKAVGKLHKGLGDK